MIACSSPDKTSTQNSNELIERDTTKLAEILGVELDTVTKAIEVNTKVTSDLPEIELDSSKCSINTLVYITRNFNSLDKSDIDMLLGTFHEDCNINVEFSEWSNEILFKTLDNYTTVVLQLLTSKHQEYDLGNILSELESPIHDGIMPHPLIEKIRGIEISSEQTEQVIKALEVAASRY